jgi:glycerophosphoryl diester phosphodiesterase
VSIKLLSALPVLLSVCYLEGREMMIIAHRGASVQEPENTMRAFEKAVQLRADMMEFDVHECASGEIVIIHNDTLDETTNGYGEVAKTPLAGLQRLDAGKGEPIPTLQKVLETFRGRIKLDIELKGRHTGKPVAYLLHEYIYHYKWPVSDILVTSFIKEELLRLHVIMPVVRLGLIFDDGEPLVYDSEIFQHIIIPISSLKPEAVSDAHARGVRVFVYTVNQSEDIRYARECDVDGIISDVPDIVRATLIQNG